MTKLSNAEPWESELSGEWNPNGTTKPCISETWESELPGEWNPNGITKLSTAEKGEMTSLENQILMKPPIRALLKEEEVNSLVNETQMEALNCAPLNYGKVN